MEEKESCESTIKDLELKIESLSTLKNESEMHIEEKGYEITELLILSESLKSELGSKSNDLAKMVEGNEGYESNGTSVSYSC